MCVGARGCARRRWVAAGLGIQCEDTSELSMLRAAEIPPFTAQKKKKNGNDRNQPLHLFIKTLPRNRVMAEKNNPHPQSPDRRWEKGTQSVLQNGLFSELRPHRGALGAQSREEGTLRVQPTPPLVGSRGLTRMARMARWIGGHLPGGTTIA